MRRDASHEVAALLVCFANEAHVAEAQGAQPSVDELRRGARGLAPEIPALDERDSHPVPGSSRGDAGTDYPATDDQEIEVATGKLLERTSAVRPKRSAHGP